MKVLLFVDGSCIGNPGETGVGVVVITQGQVTMLASHTGMGTNNTAEIQSAIFGLKYVLNKIKTKSRVVLYTDSQLVKGFLLHGWKPKVNLKLVAELKSLSSKFLMFTVEKVKAHDREDSFETFWNARADELAKWGSCLHRGDLFEMRWNLADEVKMCSTLDKPDESLPYWRTLLDRPCGLL